MFPLQYIKAEWMREVEYLWQLLLDSEGKIGISWKQHELNLVVVFVCLCCHFQNLFSLFEVILVILC